jgi:integrase
MSLTVHARPRKSTAQQCLDLCLGENVAARFTNRLTPMAVSKMRRPGLHHDGGGLYLQVSIGAGGVVNRSWILRFMLDGRSRKMGLGTVALVGLAEARERALAARRAARIDHVDPIEARLAERAERRAAAARTMTFQEAAEAYIKAHESSWSNARHRKQWPETMQAYCYPVLGSLSVAAIDTPLIMRVLRPLWTEKQETGARVRARTERVLNWAAAQGFRSGDNPARWRGHLENLLPKRNKARTVRHHTALPYRDLPKFLSELRQRKSIAARALEFTILTAARTSETLGATWDEIDFGAQTWTLSKSRMKAAEEHRVPLSAAALAILSALPRKSKLVFDGSRAPKGMAKVLLRMGRTETVHGFRATFKTWASEQTAFSPDVVEAALAHAIGNKVERSYNRGQLLEKRRRLMDAWAQYCSTARNESKVVPINAMM